MFSSLGDELESLLLADIGSKVRPWQVLAWVLGDQVLSLLVGFVLQS